MSDLTFTNQADALAFSAAIDVRLGYPKNGVDVGGGIHAPASLTRTVRHGLVMKHPVQNSWSYPHDAPVQTELSKGLALPGTASVQTKDSTWDAATPVSDGKT